MLAEAIELDDVQIEVIAEPLVQALLLDNPAGVPWGGMLLTREISVMRSGS